MSDALRYEWVRLRTLRSTYWLTGIALLVAGLLALPALSLTSSTQHPTLNAEDYGDIITGGNGGAISLMSIFLGLIGVMAIGHEYRYATMRPTLSALPRRSILMAAKVVVVLAWVAVFTLIAQALRFLIVWLILGSKFTSGHPFSYHRLWLGSIGYPMVYALIGLAFAALFRSMPAAIVILIVMPLIAENLIRALLQIDALHGIRPLGKVMPFAAGNAVMHYGNDIPFKGEQVAPWTGAIIYVAFLCIVLGIAWALFEKRDA
jgi:ABC-type transport system involved in multi-copper enzyme maturation permease subunit